jgi:predicted metal-binding membrane protein
MTYRTIRSAVVVLAAVSWLAIAILHTFTPAHSIGTSGSHALLFCRIVALPAARASPSRLAAAGLITATGISMTVAMMVPAALPAVRYVTVNTLKTRRALSVVLFITSYASIWVGLALIAALIAEGSWHRVAFLSLAAC